MFHLYVCGTVCACACNNFSMVTLTSKRTENSKGSKRRKKKIKPEDQRVTMKFSNKKKNKSYYE